MELYQKRKKFPSQIKYEENNPSISFRMKKKEKEKIRQMAKKSGISISELVRVSLLDLEKDFSEIYNKSNKEGYDQGRKDGFKEGIEKGNTDGYNNGMNSWAIWINCWKCGKPFFIIPNSKEHKKVIDEMKGWFGHDQCPQ